MNNNPSLTKKSPTNSKPELIPTISSLFLHQQRKIWWLAAAILTISISWAYQQTLQIGFLSDDQLMVAFAQISPLDGSVFIVEPIHWLLFHRPFALLIWQLMYRLWGLNPLPYHLLSLILHALSSFLLIRLAYLITPENVWSAIGAGIIFALFPLHVETVAWLACWFDLLALPFYLGTLICLIHAWQHRKIRWYLISIGLYQLAVWSKEAAFSLPAMILVVGLSLTPRPPLKRLLLSIIPYAAIIAINFLQRYLVWGSIGGYAQTKSNLLLNAWNTTLNLLDVLIVPLNRSIVPPEMVQAIGLIIGITVLFGLVLETQRRLVLFGLFWMSLTLIPVFSMLPLAPDLQNARLLYPVSVGYCLILAAALHGLASLLTKRYQVIAQLGITGCLGLTGALAIQHQVQPWVVATKASDTIIEQIEQALPPARPGSILQVVGAPDNYHGAYINRLGIDAALLARDHQLYIQWPEYRPMPIPYRELNLTGDFFQVQIHSDEQQQHWEVTQVRGVTVDTPLPPFPQTHWIYAMHGGNLVEQLTNQPLKTRPVIQSWDLENCQQIQQWQSTNLKLECHPNKGAILTPTSNDPTLIMPGVHFKTDRWTEVVVTLETLSPSNKAIAQIFWGNHDQNLNENHSVSIELPDTPRRQSYHFFIPPSPQGSTVDILRIDPINQQVPLLLTGFRIQQDH